MRFNEERFVLPGSGSLLDQLSGMQGGHTHNQAVGSSSCVVAKLSKVAAAVIVSMGDAHSRPDFDTACLGFPEGQAPWTSWPALSRRCLLLRAA